MTDELRKAADELADAARVVMNKAPEFFKDELRLDVAIEAYDVAATTEDLRKIVTRAGY